MKKIPFWKLSGSGNDFVVIDNRRHLINGNASRWAAKLCHRQFGVGADGLLLIEPSQKADFRMVYYNSNGSRATMCGNGARCIAWSAHELGMVGSNFDFETDLSIVKARVDDRVVEVTLADAKEYRPARKIRAANKVFNMVSVDTGVPHAVIEVPNVDKIDVMTYGRALRFHRAFGPKGANVNFIQRLGPNRLKVRTYERGVEGETLACGTGVVASAIAAAMRGIVKGPVRCVVAGGDTLEVSFTAHRENSGHPATNISLKGPVRLTFKGEFYPDNA
jgi:diaminopimelate epimerase